MEVALFGGNTNNSDYFEILNCISFHLQITYFIGFSKWFFLRIKQII